VSTRALASSLPPALSLIEPEHAATVVANVARTAASARWMDRLVCIVVHLLSSVPSTL
jgi:hypothetical protein